MDLRFIADAEPTPSERAALDDVLGSPGSSWEGGARLTGADGNTAAGGHAARAQRHLLLPALWALQERIGWISPGGLNDLCRRLTVPPADAYGVASFYALFALEPRPPRVVHVCEDVACRCHGSQELIAQLEERFGREGELSDDGSATWHRSPCLGQCDRAPAALVSIAGDEPLERAQAPVTAAAVLDLLAGGEPEPSPAAPLPQAGDASLRLLRRVGVADPTSIDDYRAHGGYAALRRAFELGPEGVLREVKDSKLVGRGGAAFPTGVKWEAVARQPARPHYLVCNADESEPGTFKDRELMEGDPFAVIEAMTDRRLRHGLRAGLPLHPWRVPGGAARARARARGGPRSRVSRRERDGRGPRVRRRDPARRRRVHLRRGDRDLRVDRGEARRAAQQAAVPRRGRPLRKADRGEQRRDARQRARRRARLRPGVRRGRHRGLDRVEAPLPLGPRRAPRHVRGAFRGDAARACSISPAASRAGGPCRRC